MSKMYIPTKSAIWTESNEPSVTSKLLITIKPIAGDIDMHRGTIKPIAGDIGMLNGTNEPIAGDIDMHRGTIKPIAGDINMHSGTIKPIAEDIGMLNGTNEPIATTPKCRGWCYSIPWIAPLHPWSLPFNAEC